MSHRVSLHFFLAASGFFSLPFFFVSPTPVSRIESLPLIHNLHTRTEDIALYNNSVLTYKSIFFYSTMSSSEAKWHPVVIATTRSLLSVPNNLLSTNSLQVFLSSHALHIRLILGFLLYAYYPHPRCSREACPIYHTASPRDIHHIEHPMTYDAARLILFAYPLIIYIYINLP